ncbi:uncharacterized protein AKAW2_70981A [Aspergillus luchuensis]|uniref:IgE-binding protein n=1 Tax=Aspergillus kawachii TaxID=1069201 RepID=A0A146F4N6_ASPKA|nr:uncharacterized protein AKAW2_70981A [Aspergillus luchuensis]BCS04103.1 hypothetical protein AKAW2_70981A [Aspergillus luchuensis]BCS15702.1 hypothetical protein ALUC_70935A [Aspergillus luchuensis]GAT21087.1 hypothetical protein RIB2604_00901080 [Aspergillus luchuensis]
MAFLATFISLLTLVTPALSATNCSTGAFTVMSIRSGTFIQNLPLTAADTNFYLGGTTSTACPEDVAEYDACPPGDETVIDYSNYLSSGYVQEIYVDPTGALKFVEAHTTYMDPGASTSTFCYTPGTSYGQWTYTGLGATGFMACPLDEDEEVNGGAWQVFAAMKNATVPSGNVSDCLQFEALAYPWVSNGSSIAAWQYD